MENVYLPSQLTPLGESKEFAEARSRTKPPNPKQIPLFLFPLKVVQNQSHQFQHTQFQKGSLVFRVQCYIYLYIHISHANSAISPFSSYQNQNCTQSAYVRPSKKTSKVQVARKIKVRANMPATCSANAQKNIYESQPQLNLSIHIYTYILRRIKDDG